MEANQVLRAQFSSALSTALEDVDTANKDLFSSIDRQYLIIHAHYCSFILSLEKSCSNYE